MTVAVLAAFFALSMAECIFLDAMLANVSCLCSFIFFSMCSFNGLCL